MPRSLQSRKQELVRDAIYDAAIKLFTVKGFDETTVEEIANAASISRRSFFRYFASKDDLLAPNVANIGKALVKAINDCPPSMSPREVIRETVAQGSKYAAAQPRTRQTIEISVRSVSARRAHLSRMNEVGDCVAEAFAARIKGASKDDFESRMFAGIALLLMNLTLFSWSNNEHEDLSSSYGLTFASVTGLLSGKSGDPSDSKVSFDRRKESMSAAK